MISVICGLIALVCAIFALAVMVVTEYDRRRERRAREENRK